MNFDVCIVGNGIIGTSIAYKLHRRNPNLKIALVGQRERQFSASLAAGAMLNVYAEIDENTFKSSVTKEKFNLAARATDYWPKWLDDIMSTTPYHIDLNLGTYVTCSNHNDVENYERIKNQLDMDEQAWEEVDPLNLNVDKEDLPLSVLYIKNEGWVSPYRLFGAFDFYLSMQPNITVIDKGCYSISNHDIILNDNSVINAKQIVVCAGTESQLLLSTLYGLSMPTMFYGVGSSILLDNRYGLERVIRTPVRLGSCGLNFLPYGAGAYLGASSWVTKMPEISSRYSSIQYMLNEAPKQINKNISKAKIVDIKLGWRPVTEDTMPLIGALDVAPHIFICSGTRRDGFHMSPLLAEDIVNRLLGEKPLVSDNFKPERKPHRFLTKEEGIQQAFEAKMNYMMTHDLYMNDIYYDIEKKYEPFDYGVPAELYDVLINV